MEGARVSVNVGGRLLSGRLKGRGNHGEYIVIADRNGGTYYTRQPLMSHEEAARFLSAGQPVIRRLIRDGKLVPIHVGRSLRLACDNLDGLVSAAAAMEPVSRARKVKRRRAKRALAVTVKAKDSGAAKGEGRPTPKRKAGRTAGAR